jgi:hypothetical protein
MSNVIGKDYDYDWKSSPKGSRPIKTSVKLFSSSKDAFSHKASVRHTKFIDEPMDYEDMAGGHKNERE